MSVTNWLILGAIALGLINAVQLMNLKDDLRWHARQVDFRLRNADSIDQMMRHVWAKVDWNGYREWRIGERRWPEFIDRTSGDTND